MEEKNYIGIDELKRIQLDILSDISNFCETNNLSYYLAYGTLIGAIRHKGYIPWDDDIDICMPRPDYEIFMEKYNQHSSTFRAACLMNDECYSLPYGKVYDIRTHMHETQWKDNVFGVYIDVFPVDGYSSKFRVAMQFVLFKLLNTKNAILKSNRSIGKKLLHAFGKIVLLPVSAHQLLLMIERNAKHVKFESAEYVTCMVTEWANREAIEKKHIEELTDCSFENREYKIPIGFDVLLRKCYGDYMKFPPLEEQKPHHVYLAWWK